MTGAKPATFSCPNCGKVYPVLPSLIDRSVRCNACREPFRLHPDGRVELVQPEPETKTAPASQSTPAPARGPLDTEESDFATAARAAPSSDSSVRRRAADPQAETRAQLAAAAQRVAERTGKPAQRGPSTPAPDRAGSSTRPVPSPQRSSKQDLTSIRKSMSATLSTAAAAAAQTVRQDSPAAPPADRPRASVPSLSGEGVETAKRDLRWLLGLLAMIAVIVGVIWLASGYGPLQQRLADYASPVLGATSPGERIRALRERSLLATVDGINRPLLLSDPGSMRAGTPTRVPLIGISELFVDRVVLPEYALLVPSERVDEVRRLARGLTAEADDGAGNEPELDQPGPSGPRSVRALALALDAAGIPARTFADLHAELIERVPVEAAAFVIEALVAGTTGNRDQNSWRELLETGAAPSAIEFVPMRGRDALRLRPQGLSVVMAEPLPSYTALLIRFEGVGWPSEWAVLDVHEHDALLREPTPLLNRMRQADAHLDSINAPPEPVDAGFVEGDEDY